MNALDAAIYATLAASAPLTALLAAPTAIYKDVAPSGSALPFVVFQQHGEGSVQYAMGRSKAFEGLSYVVRGISEGSDQMLAGSLADHIFAALQDAPLSVSGFSTLVCHLAGRVAYTENDEGVLIRHAGGRYMIEVA